MYNLLHSLLWLLSCRHVQLIERDGNGSKVLNGTHHSRLTAHDETHVKALGKGMRLGKRYSWI